MNIKYIIKGGFFVVLFFLFFNYTYGAVDAGEDQTVSIGDSVILNGSVEGFEDCMEVLYYWSINDGPREIAIDPNYLLVGSIIPSDQTIEEGEYYIRLDVTGRYCGPDYLEGSEMDIVVITIEGGISNSSPTDINLSNNRIDENVDGGTFIGSFSTTDPDDSDRIDTYQYKLVGGEGAEDNDSFTITGDELEIIGSPDFEGQEEYSIRVETQDSDGATYEEVFTIYINNIDETVVIVDAGANQTVSIGDSVTLNGSVEGFEDCMEVLYYWSINDGPREIAIDPNYLLEGSMITSDQTTLEGEYYINLDVEGRYCGPDYFDRSGIDTIVITIDEGISNSSPTNIDLSNNRIDENVDGGTFIGSFSTTDPDDSDRIDIYKYTLVGGEGAEDNNSFAITGNELKIVGSPDFEIQEEYSIRIQTQDSSLATYEEVFTIYIDDIDESVPNVNAGSNQSVKIGDIVSLTGNISGFPASGCIFEYNWYNETEEVTISNPGFLTGASFETDSFSGTTTITIGLDVFVSSTEITHDSCGKNGLYQDFLDINISELGEKKSSGISYSEKMRKESKIIFESIDKIIMFLENIELNDNKTYKLKWNYIGGDGVIKYEIIYSNGVNFKNNKIFFSHLDHIILYYHDLDLEGEIFFFKVRALYENQKSDWSNTISVINKRSLLKDFKISCIDCEKKISFQDVFDTVDLLIEKELDINCINCDKEVQFFDILESKDFLLNGLNIKCTLCNQKLDFSDSLKESEDLNTCTFDNIKCNSVKKIDFSDLIK